MWIYSGTHTPFLCANPIKLYPFHMLGRLGPSTQEDSTSMSRKSTDKAFFRNSSEIPANWKESLILNHYIYIYISLHCGKYRGLNHPDQVTKLLEQVADISMCKMVNIDVMQFGFVSDRGTTDSSLMVYQLQAKYITANKPLYVAFVDFDKAYDRVPSKVLWTLMGFSVKKNGLCVSTRGCAPMPSAMCRSMVNPIKSFW